MEWKKMGRKVQTSISVEEEKIEALRLVLSRRAGFNLSRSKAVQIAIDEMLQREGVEFGVDVRVGDVSRIEELTGLRAEDAAYKGGGRSRMQALEGPARPLRERGSARERSIYNPDLGMDEFDPAIGMTAREFKQRLEGANRESAKIREEEFVKAIEVREPKEREGIVEEEEDPAALVKRMMRESGIIPDATIVNEPTGEAV